MIKLTTEETIFQTSVLYFMVGLKTQKRTKAYFVSCIERGMFAFTVTQKP